MTNTRRTGVRNFGSKRLPRHLRNEELPRDNFTARTYQVELLDSALHRNTIISMGYSGRMFIAVLLMKEMAENIRKPLSKGGKRTIFLVNTEDMIAQQMSTIQHQTDLEIICIKENDDSCNGEWGANIDKTEVLITTGSIFLSILQREIIHIDQINLLIFDECHLVVENHPYTEIMNCYSSMDKLAQPRILGLTSAILSVNKQNPEELGEIISAVEKGLQSTAETSTLVLFERYGVKPREEVVECADYEDTTGLSDQLADILESAIDFLDECNIEVTEDLDYRDPMLIPKAALIECHNVLRELGPWCAACLADMLVGQIEKIEKQKEFIALHKKFLNIGATNLRMVSKIFEKHFSTCDYSVDELLKYSSPKVTSLMNCLRLYRPETEFVIISEDIETGSKHHDTDDDDEDADDDAGNEGIDSDMSDSDFSDNEDSDTGHKSESSKQVHVAIKKINNDNKPADPFALDEDKYLCGLVFVEDQHKAYALNKFIEEVCSWDEGLCFVKSMHLTGKIEKQKKLYKKQEEILRKFRMQELNLLISTNILEEGVDIPKCNFVCRFDAPKSYRSYSLSKGRARARDAAYVILVEEEHFDEFNADLKTYSKIEKVLIGRCRRDSIEEETVADPDDNDIQVKPYVIKTGEDSLSVTLDSAIMLVNRYCAKLPSDAFTHLTPTCKVSQIREGDCILYKATLRLPINSPIKQDLQGPVMGSKLKAKRAVALKMCEVLHKAGELDDNLMPIGKEMFHAEEEEEVVLDEEEDLQGEARPGTTKRKQYYCKKICGALLNSGPSPKVECKLYVVSMTLTGAITDEQNTRGRRIFAPEESPRGFGILTPNFIPLVPLFPVFTRSGEVTISVELMASNVLLDAEQLDKLHTFHRFLISNVLRLEKDPMEYKPQEASVGYILVPLNKEKTSTGVTIDWAFTDKVVDSQTNSKSTEESFTFKQAEFEDAVVMPSYRNMDQPQYFYVAEIRHDLNPQSPFPSPELYKTFAEYYTTKYGLKISNVDQPLLDVDHTSARLNLLIPRYMNQKGVALPTSSAETKKARRENLQQKQILIPELCDIHVFPASLWRKAVCLPAILYRMNHLLLAEEIRKNVARETNIGIAELDEKHRFPRLDFGFDTNPENLKMRMDDKSDSDEETDNVKQNGEVEVDNGKIDDEECDDENDLKDENEDDETKDFNNISEKSDINTEDPKGITTASPVTPQQGSDVQNVLHKDIEAQVTSPKDIDLLVSSPNDIDAEIDTNKDINEPVISSEELNNTSSKTQKDEVQKSVHIPNGYISSNETRATEIKCQKEDNKKQPSVLVEDVEDETIECEGAIKTSGYAKLQSHCDTPNNSNISADSRQPGMTNTTDRDGGLEEEDLHFVFHNTTGDPSTGEFIDGRSDCTDDCDKYRVNTEHLQTFPDRGWDEDTNSDGTDETGGSHIQCNICSTLSAEIGIDNLKVTNCPECYKLRAERAANGPDMEEGSSHLPKQTEETQKSETCKSTNKLTNRIESDEKAVKLVKSEEVNHKSQIISSSEVENDKIKIQSIKDVQNKNGVIKKNPCKAHIPKENLLNGMKESEISESELENESENLLCTKNNNVIDNSENNETSEHDLHSSKEIDTPTNLKDRKKSEVNTEDNSKEKGNSEMEDIDNDLNELDEESTNADQNISPSKQVIDIFDNISKFDVKPEKKCEKRLEDYEFPEPLIYMDEDVDMSTFVGPSPCVVLQALTMSNANDFFSLERLETIGDSFLKYAITVYLYCSYPGIHEGKLSYLRSKQVSNYNLYRLGKRKGLGECMISTKFEPYENWLPPGYVVNEDRRKGPVPKVCIASLSTKTSPIFGYGNQSEIDDLVDKPTRSQPGTQEDPVSEPISFMQCEMKQDSMNSIQSESKDKSLSNISHKEHAEESSSACENPEMLNFFHDMEEIDQIEEEEENEKDNDRLADKNRSTYCLQVHHCLPDKSIADSVEALIGCYLTSCDKMAALNFMAWMGLKVLPVKDKSSKSQNCERLPCPPSPFLNLSAGSGTVLEHLLTGYQGFERKIGYTFKDRAYLLQAFTHASYHYNTVTDCYQRLEFLGDAVLDYVITRHLYEDSDKYTPGVLTDLRSALVNNNIFAALAVKWDFHKYFKAISPSLFYVIEKFVARQKDKEDEIDIDDDETDNDQDKEHVELEVPKALGDIFESVAGAIYLDSGMSLDAVWRVFYRIMKTQIDKYLKDIPKSPVRELLEQEPETAKFDKPERTMDGKIRVTVNVVGKGVFTGVGRNYRIAKSAAAKKALRCIKTLEQQGLI